MFSIFKKLPKFLKNSFFVSFSKVFSSLTNLIFMVYSVNLMTKSENGMFQYYLGFFPILLALAEFGLPSALVKYLSPETNNLEKSSAIMKASIIVKWYTFLFLLVIGILGISFFKDGYFVLFLLIFGAYIASFTSYFESILVSYRDYLLLSIWNPLPNLIRLIGLYIMASYTKISYLEILTIYCLSPLFIFLFFFIISSHRNVSFQAKDNSQVVLYKNQLMVFNFWTFAATIFAIVSDRLEIFFLKYYHGPEIVAEYGTILQLFSGFVIILSVLNTMIYPKMSILVHTQDFKKFLLKSVGIGFLLALMLLPGIFFGKWIINYLFKGIYSNSIPIFHILYPNFLLQLVFAPLGIALFSLGLPRFLAILAFIRLISGLILDNILIPNYGSKGAAIALFLGQIVSWIVLVGYMISLLKSKNAD